MAVAGLTPGEEAIILETGDRTMKSLQDIAKKARSCTRCYGNKPIYVPLFDPGNSSGKADIVFVNERPNIIGTGESGYVSFENDDPSAAFFRECFDLAGLRRKRVFISNACLCRPDFSIWRSKGKTPTITELENCHYWLEQQLKITQPKLIVTVGERALQSVLRYLRHWRRAGCPKLSDIVGKPIMETDPWVFPVNHTADRGRANRKAELQKADWLKIPGILEQAQKQYSN